MLTEQKGKTRVQRDHKQCSWLKRNSKAHTYKHFLSCTKYICCGAVVAAIDDDTKAYRILSAYAYSSISVFGPGIRRIVSISLN